MKLLEMVADWMTGEKQKFMEAFHDTTEHMNWSHEAKRYHGELNYMIYQLQKKVKELEDKAK